MKVQMFGGCRMEYQGRVVTIEKSNTTKTNQLFQLLVCYPGGLTREQLVNNIFQNEEITDASNSIRALVFRLRKNLKEQGILGGEYVSKRRGVYVLDEKFQVSCDVHEFEHKAELAFAEQEPDKRYQLLRESCELYTGEFLPNLGAADWVVVLNVRYKNLYFQCLREFCELCGQRKEYMELYQVAVKAAEIYPFDGWQSYEMDALIAMNRTKEAAKLYETTEQLMFRELGVALPEHMVKQMERLGHQVQNNTDVIENVIGNMDEVGENMGALECSYPNFVWNYRFIRRFIERTGQTAWLMLCTITNGKGYALEGGDRLTYLYEDLWNALKATLRRGDMFAQYSRNQVVILLMEVKQEDCARVSERINEHLGRKNTANYIQYHLAPVNTQVLIEREETNSSDGMILSRHA
jgi:DNA-binding SARP family transcriptional activator